MSTRPYGGMPLLRKLGIDRVRIVHVHAAPDGYADWLAPLPAGLVLDAASGPACELVHLFVTEREDLAARLAALRTQLRAEVPVWVSWPKKASRVPTTLDEDAIRALALPLGYVDIKVCAVSPVWSGLKLVVRRALR